MNRTVRKYIDGIATARTIYENNVGSCLLEYRNRKEKIIQASKRYKDEDSYIDEYLPAEQDNCRRKMSHAEDTFRSELKKNIDGLKSELQAAINAPIPQAFVDRLSFYRSAKLTPTRTEVESLISMAQKNPLCIRAISQLLDDLEAPITVESRSIEEYEKDLENLDDLVRMPLVCPPYEVHTEAVELLTGTPKTTRTGSGWRDIGETWNGSVDILLQGVAVTSRLNGLASVADSWETDVTTSIREREHSAHVAREKSEQGEKYKPENTPESTVHIKDRNDAITLATNLGKEQAEQNAAVKSPYAL